MALSHSPKIVTDGLVLCLDAGDGKSYSGSGSTWIDRSGKSYNATLVNSPSIVDGAFDFSTNEYADITINSSSTPELVPVDEDFSVEIAYKFANTSARQKFLGTGNYGRGGWNLGIGYSNFNEIGFAGYNDQCDDGTNCRYNRGNVSYAITLDTTSFWHIIITYNMTDLYTRMYINGNLVKSQYDSTRGTGSNTNGQFRIGRTSQGGWGSKKGYCKFVRFYNRSLSTDEAIQNYNAVKGKL